MKAKTTLAFLLVSAAGCIRHTPSGPGLPYSVLDNRQVALFATYPDLNGSDPATYWTNSVDATQRVEYAGGTRVVIAIETGTHSQVLLAISKIHGREAEESSAAQFNTEVVWKKDAAPHFSKLPHWTEHWALLHPGQHGYQENRDDNPFLGLVVLFDADAPDAAQVCGQYHIGFRMWFAHYFPENGDLGDHDNYQLYKRWYGPIPNFEPVLRLPPAPAVFQVTGAAIPAEPQANIEGSVRAFLQAWYVDRANLQTLERFIARDNGFQTARGERGAREALASLFAGAFLTGVRGRAAAPRSLGEAIEFPAAMAGRARLGQGSVVNGQFGIFRPESLPRGAYLPAQKPANQSQLPNFLYHLGEAYKGKLYVVLYAAKGAGMVREGVVSYWIEEEGKWKLAGLMGTD